MQIDLLRMLQLGAALLIGWSIYRDRHATTLTKAAKDSALVKVRGLVSVDGDPRFHFHGATSRILKIEEIGVVRNAASHAYTLAVWAENTYEEMFHIRVNAEDVLLKHVPDNVARVHFPDRKSLSDR